MSKTEQEELQALMYAGVPEVPAEADEKTPVWIFAIAKCITYAMRETFVIVKMNYGRGPIIIRAFNDDGVAQITSVHPYKFLDSRFVPKFNSAQETNKFIAESYGVEPHEVSKLKKEERLRLFYTFCIKRQLEYEKDQSNKKDL